MKIKLIKQVTYKDWHGVPYGDIPVGTILEATVDMGHYWVTSHGGIYKSEAELVTE